VRSRRTECADHSKTIEYHLGNTYRKLDVRSRAELGRIVASPELSSTK